MCEQNLRPTTRRRRDGITLVETVLAVLILGGAFVSVLSTVASSRAAHATAAQRQFGLVLAQDLMDEVLTQKTYKEGNTIGPDSGETTGDRSLFDDIDDYDGWSSTPPTDVDGNTIVGADGYTRSVTVRSAQVLSPGDDAIVEQGLKRVVVIVTYGDKVVAELTACRSDVWAPGEESY